MKRGLLVNVGLALGVSILFLAGLEGVARLFAPPPPPPREVAEYIWDWDEMMPGGFYVMRSHAVGWPPWEEFNRDGLRDRTWPHEKPGGTWRVAFLGDSVTMGAGLKPEESYPRVLDARMHAAGRRIEAMSVALWGWSTRQERIAWHRIARLYHPDQAVLAVCLNDIPELHNNLSRPPQWLAWLHERSALVRLVVRAQGREIEDVERLFSSPDSSRVREAMARFFDEVKALRAEVEKDGARLDVVVFPFRFQVGEAAGAPAVQEKISAFCTTEGLRCLDLLPVLRRSGASAFLDYDHLSAAGSALVADTLFASDLLPAGFSNPQVLEDRLEGHDARGAAEVREWLAERAHVPGDAGLRVLVHTLGADGAEERMAAAWALEMMARAAGPSRPALERMLLEDPSSGARMAAARALGALGPVGAPAKKILFDALWDESEPVRYAAADALLAAGVGEGDMGRLAESLKSEDSYVRGFAAWSLGNLGPAAKPAVPALVAILDEPDTGATVISALARIGPGAGEAVPALVATLKNGDADQRWRAARTLGRIGKAARSATPDLIAALGDTESGVRRHAARALGRVSSADGPAPAALQRATGDRNAGVREEARRALDRLSGKPPARGRQVESAREDE